MIRCGPIITAAHRAPSGKLRREAGGVRWQSFLLPFSLRGPEAVSTRRLFRGAVFVVFFISLTYSRFSFLRWLLVVRKSCSIRGVTKQCQIYI